MDFPRPPKWKRVLTRVAVVAIALFVVTVIAGFAVQRWRDAHVPAAPGSFAVLPDGRRIHYLLAGEGKYTFVLDAGLGDYSGSWKQFGESLGEVGRTFAFDRAGLGWSDPAPGPASYDRMADDLHRALEAAHIPPPYVLVGHSLGGLTQTYFATRYPQGVAGMLLIDPACREQFRELPRPPLWYRLVVAQLTRVAVIGLPQMILAWRDPVKAQVKHMTSGGAEGRLVLSGVDPWHGGKIDLGSVPLYILTSGVPAPVPGWSEAKRKAMLDDFYNLHEQLLTTSTSPIRRHIQVAGSNHYIHGDHAAEVIAAARELVGRVDLGM